MSYKSPIEVITEEVTFQMEDNIVKAVQNYGISVNKIELQKALMYDRKQYTQGFEDGKKYAEAELVKHGSWVGIDDFPHEDWECTNCGYIIYGDDDIRDLHYCPSCGAKMDGGDL